MKTNKIYFFFLLSLFLCGNNSPLVGQHVKQIFHVVEGVPDSIKVALACVEAQKNHLENAHDSSYMPFLINNLISPKDYLFKDGIYGWNVMGPHFPRRVFIYYKGKLQVFKSIYINNLLQEYLDYLKVTDIPVPLRIKYLRAMSKYLQEEYENEHGKIDGKRRKK